MRMTLDETYEELKERVERMSPGDKINRLCGIRTELFVLANSYAGGKTGRLAVVLHESCNLILGVMQGS